MAEPVENVVLFPRSTETEKSSEFDPDQELNKLLRIRVWISLKAQRLDSFTSSAPRACYSFFSC